MNIQNKTVPLRESSFAITSLVISTISVLLFLLSIYIALYIEDTNDVDVNLATASFLLLSISVVFSSIGISQRDRRRRLAIIAVIINAALFILFFIGVLYGMTMAGVP